MVAANKALGTQDLFDFGGLNFETSKKVLLYAVSNLATIFFDSNSLTKRGNFTGIPLSETSICMNIGFCSNPITVKYEDTIVMTSSGVDIKWVYGCRALIFSFA